MSKRKSSLSKYKYEAAKAARDLFYGEDVIRRIHRAKTEGEVANILATERKRRLEDPDKHSLYSGDKKATLPQTISRQVRNWR